MSPYFAAAVQAMYSGAITFIVACFASQGITADVTSLTVMAMTLAYALTLILSLVRDYMLRDDSKTTTETIKIPEPDEVLAQNPFHDPDLVDRAKALLDDEAARAEEQQIREFFRTRSARARAQFGPGNIWETEPKVRYVMKNAK